MKTSFFSKLAIACLCIPTLVCAQPENYPFRNQQLSFEQRVNDLVSRLTLEEKVSQMLNASPAIPRLGIPAHDWWNEVLHGVARTPYRTTVFPQAIAMAATFDAAALYRMADYSALEGRVIYNKAIAAGQEGRKYLGLTYWTPNINIFRDPRWGRGQETYGEDPFLTGVLGDAFVRGLQGNDPKYLKAAACAKHYAVHSGPESVRHTFNADVSAYDLYDTYLPAFRKLVVESKVEGVMCAYNAFRKQPCCASDILMNDILREQWKFTGYVTSDCGAIDDFYKKHKTHPDAKTAAADAVFHGTDVDCGREAYYALVQAVKEGLIPEKQIDVSVKRLYMTRFRLGHFDPPAQVSYTHVADSVLESKTHAQHALQMARESMVLLKNAGNTLPLTKNLQKIVVLGPNADNAVSILGNYNGFPSRLYTVFDGIREKAGPQTQVVYEQAINFTNNRLLEYEDISALLTYEGKQGFKAEYFSNIELKGQPAITRTEANLKHTWQEAQQVAGEVNALDFSARYTTELRATTTRSITFELNADNGYRLYVNGQLKIDEWKGSQRLPKRLDLAVKKDSVYKLVVEYFQTDRDAYVRLEAGKYGNSDFNAIAAKHKDADVFIVAGGISPQLEGEQMKVTDPGFDGGDRTTILLPEVQTALMKTLTATGKPVVFVMMTGSAIAIPWEAQHVPAIINAWYGGQAAGLAVADILFGDYNPSGRLPVTFYCSDKDLPPFEDYSMNNRTYRYFTGKPLYGFGYGLSYTTFRYDQLILPAQAKNSKVVPVSVRVTNTGKRAGEEVVQLYISLKGQNIKTSLRSLKGFKRIQLKPGESKLVQLTINREDLSYIAEDGTRKQFTGAVQVSVGGCQPGEPNAASGNVQSKNIRVQ